MVRIGMGRLVALRYVNAGVVGSPPVRIRRVTGVASLPGDPGAKRPRSMARYPVTERGAPHVYGRRWPHPSARSARSEEHTSELQSLG